MLTAAQQEERLFHGNQVTSATEWANLKFKRYVWVVTARSSSLPSRCAPKTPRPHAAHLSAVPDCHVLPAVAHAALCNVCSAGISPPLHCCWNWPSDLPQNRVKRWTPDRWDRLGSRPPWSAPLSADRVGTAEPSASCFWNQNSSWTTRRRCL